MTFEVLITDSPMEDMNEPGANVISLTGVSYERLETLCSVIYETNNQLKIIALPEG